MKEPPVGRGITLGGSGREGLTSGTTRAHRPVLYGYSAFQ